jgi:transcription elongation factor Elf1
MNRPKCPNHGCEMNKTDNKSIYICPISGARFEVSVEENESKKKVDINGREILEFKLTPLDGIGG